jgi:hypothetical protein
MALNKQETLFCTCFAQTGDAAAAARRAGFSSPETAGPELLARRDVRRALQKCYAARGAVTGGLVRSGYERLAFGGVADAVKLLFTGEDQAAQVEGMDFFNVEEIRRPREGALEIRFFDRLRALEKLQECGETEGAAAPLYRALEKSAEQLAEMNGDAGGSGGAD